MLTSYAEDEMLFSAIRAGAAGYVLKQIGGEDLVRAIEAVGRGEALLDPAVTQRIFQEVRKAAKEEEASAFSALTQQEKHVLLLVSEGKTNREIAKALFLGEGTVRNYVSSILSKLGSQQSRRSGRLRCRTQPQGIPVTTFPKTLQGRANQAVLHCGHGHKARRKFQL